MNRPLWHRATEFAAHKHQHQFRKDGCTPYIVHPFRVAMTVAQVFGFGDPGTLAAALLHDTLEDTTTDYEDLETEFGPWVAQAVAQLTDNKALAEEQRRADYHARLAAADWRVLLIKLADAHDNLTDASTIPGSEFLAKTDRKARQVLELVRPRAGESEVLARALRMVEELCIALVPEVPAGDQATQEGGRAQRLVHTA